jgi:hypothetical protein
MVRSVSNIVLITQSAALGVPLSLFDAFKIYCADTATNKSLIDAKARTNGRTLYAHSSTEALPRRHSEVCTVVYHSPDNSGLAIKRWPGVEPYRVHAGFTDFSFPEKAGQHLEAPRDSSELKKA